MTEVRVRIAPSPTGSPHVGTAYIALFNYAFARANNGKFVLRIEDTDQTRSHPVYEAAILDALRWVGMKWDEGPDIGGDSGPYRQSERTELYRHHADELLARGGAYRCFCTGERLAEMRREQLRQKLPLKYDGRCRSLTEEEIGKKLQAQEPFTMRLKIPEEGKTVIADRLRGQVTYEHKEIDDQILLKSDGFPTYHLANVVDDHLMGISHVIRGEEWLPSTPKHVLLYDFFGWDKPEFIHMPLLLNPDGSKLSKRKNPTSISYYKDAGYLPEALLNFLGMMGYSRPEGQEKFTVEEMISDFDIDRVSLGGSVFDLVKLRWLTGKYIRENYTPEQLAQKLLDWRLTAGFLQKIMPLVQQRLETLGDFMPLSSFFWAREVDYPAESLAIKKRDTEQTVKVLQSLLFLFDEVPVWESSHIENKLHEIGRIWEWKIREVTGVLFVAISGSKVAPPLYESMELLGKDLCRVRIVAAINKLGGISKKKAQQLEKEFNQRKMALAQDELR